MGFYVQKFGGTSVGTPERIKSVARRIEKAHRKGDRLVVVVSAMGQSTDELIDLAHQVSPQPPHREMDMLLTVGERVSMALLSIALAELNVPAISLTGSQTGIITDSSHRRARIQKILGDRVRAALGEGKVVIVAGFQGVSAEKEITTLGRGGSDTTAVALAASLGADGCEIYTDVDGVYSADPRVVPGAKLWRQISPALMAEMASRGAGVLHPRCVMLAKKYGVKLWVKNSLKENEGEGTEMTDRGSERVLVLGVTSDDGKMLVDVELARAASLTALGEAASQAGLTVLAPTYQHSEQSTQVRFYAEKDARLDWQRILDQLQRDGFTRSFALREDITPVSVVGECFSQDPALFHRSIEVLAANNISVTIGSSSALAMTLGVKSDQAQSAVRLLHKEWLEK